MVRLNIEFLKLPVSHARGRNGFFIPTRADITGHKSSEGDMLRVEIKSRRFCRDTGPIMFQIGTSDAEQLANAILEVLKEL